MELSELLLRSTSSSVIVFDPNGTDVSPLPLDIILKHIIKIVYIYAYKTTSIYIKNFINNDEKYFGTRDKVSSLRWVGSSTRRVRLSR